MALGNISLLECNTAYYNTNKVIPIYKQNKVNVVTQNGDLASEEPQVPHQALVQQIVCR